MTLTKYSAVGTALCKGCGHYVLDHKVKLPTMTPGQLEELYSQGQSYVGEANCPRRGCSETAIITADYLLTPDDLNT